MTRQLCTGAMLLCMALPVKSQRITSTPEMVVARQEPFVGTSFFIPDSNKIMVLHKGEAKFYSVDGKENGRAVSIRQHSKDLLHPSVSPSGKIIAFYTAPENFMEDAKISLFNRDSGYVTGTYKVPGAATLERLRFSGDSILHYFVQFTDFKVSFVWNIPNEKIRNFSITEDTLHSGMYDMAFYKDRSCYAIRHADSLALYIANSSDPKQQWPSFYSLPAANTKLQVQFAQGFPHLILGDESLQQTRIYTPADSTFKETIIPGIFEVITAAGNQEHCYILYKDSSNGNDDRIRLLDAITGKTIVLPLSSRQSGELIFYIYPDKELLTASHSINGSIAAWNTRSGEQLWSFSPAMETKNNITIPTDSSDSKLFKVLIKQGSGDVQQWYYNEAANQLHLFKNQGKLVTVDADSKCAVSWDYFNRDNYRVTGTKLLPGYRYILYTEERWEKDYTATRKSLTGETERNEDVNKDGHIFPYSCKIYDRETGKDIFTMLASSQTDVSVLNDSLISFWDMSNKENRDSVVIYNLNSGSYFKVKPSGKDIYSYKALMLQDQLYFFSTNFDDQLVLTNDKGKEIFSRSYTGNSAAIEKVKPVGDSPFFYLEGDSKKPSQLFKIDNNTVTALRKFPLNIDILASKANKEGCYFLYKKTLDRKKGQMVHYRFMNMLNGNDRLIDSVTVENDKPFAQYEIFPEANYYLESENNIISWKDLNSGMDFKDFGRDEPTLVSLVYSPDGRYLAAANPSGKVMLWDLGTGKETKTLQVASGGYITRLAFSGDGKWLAAASGDIWETASGKNVVSVTDGSIWAVNSIDFSTDGKRIISGGACVISWDAADGSKLQYQQEPRHADMDTTGTCWNRYGCVDPRFAFMVYSTAFHPNSRDFVVGNVSGLVQKWNTEHTELLASKYLSQQAEQEDKIYDIRYTRDGNYVITVQQKTLYRLDGNTLQVLDSLLLPQGETVLAIDMSYDGKYFGCITSRNNQRIVQLRNINDLQVEKEFYTEGASFNKISFSPNKKQAATASEDGFCSIWDIYTGKPVMYLNTIGDFGNVMVTPDNYYMASKSALDGVSFSKDNNFYSFDQFDLYLNRPDIVLGRLGYASPELLEFYRSAYLKRLKKATGSTTDTSINNYVPLLKLSNRKNIAAVNSNGTTLVNFSITDSLTGKGKLKIFINGNLIKEHAFNGGQEVNFNYADSVVLSQGVNNVEALYVNQLAVESRKEKITISHSPAKPVAAKLWFIGIGVSRYKLPEMNLKYPAKDVRDLAAAFKKKYPSLLIDTLVDAKATRENILALREKLLKTGINDKVIISFNGHGLLSDSLDWYFATYDVDIKKPETNGLSYVAMENLLQGIPARQKLLLLDACHSGEVDKEKDISFMNRETTMEKNVVATTTARGNIVIGKSKAGLQTSFEMMQELFANLNNGNGATVLSAAGGREYALESDEWKNGVFTYSVLKALKDPATDENNDKKISVKELKKAVFYAVKNLTGGRQKPTSRVELLDDWNIW